MSLNLKDIQAAAERIGNAVVETRFEKSTTLSAILGCDIHLKFENLQFTSSFKDRGSLNKLLLLPEAQKQAGVIAMSAGNHAKAVAYHGQRLGIPTTIVMPVNTPNVKVEDTRNFDAEVILAGTSLDEAAVHAGKIAGERGLGFIHPYDDEQIMAGQGTVALELLAAKPELDAIVVPIGGGGLISGIAVAAKALKPDIKIIGVEVAGFTPVKDARPGQDARHYSGNTIAEGIAVKYPGKLCMEIIDKLVDDVLVVDEETIEEAIYLLITIEKTVAEGAGAATLAALMQYPETFRDMATAVIISGANIDSRILASVLMRRLVRKGRIVRYLVKITDLPGILSDVSQLVGELGGNILEVSHQRMFASVPVKEADLYLTVETRDAEQAREILEKLQSRGYAARFVEVS